MRCAKCGSENPEGKIVCTRCGARLRAGVGGVISVVEQPERFMGWLRADLARLVIVTAVVIAVTFALGTLVR